MKIKQLFVWLFVSTLFFCTTSIFCADISISLELSGVHYLKKNNRIEPTAFLGETFQLKSVLSGSKKVLDNIEIEGLENFIQQGKSTHSLSSRNNYNLTIEKTTQYTLLPKKEGVFKLGPATFVKNGETFKSNTVTVNVSRKTEDFHDSFVSDKQNESEYEFFCKLSADKKNVFIEEPVVITLSIYHRGKIASIRGMRAPSFPNCTVKEIKKLNEFEQEIKNKTFSVKEKLFIIYPQKPGAIDISSGQIFYNIHKKMDDDFFSNFFNFGTEQKVAASNSLKINVKKLPDTNKNVDGVGDFESFRAVVDKTEATVNEPIKLTLNLTGQANLDLILSPKLNLPKIFKSYESKVETNDQTKNFEYILQVSKVGTFVIPEQIFNYFDTKTETYKILKTEPITLKLSVPEGQIQTTPKIIAPDDQEEQKQEVLQDINFIEEDVSVNKTVRFSLGFLFFLFIILLTPLLFYFKTIYGLINSRFLGPLVATFFTSKKSIYSKYQKNINNLIEQNETEKFYKLFIDFLSDICKISKNSINEDWIKKSLKKSGANEEKIDLFINFLNECAQYSFGSKKDDFDLKDFEKKSNYWLLFIYNTLGRQK